MRIGRPKKLLEIADQDREKLLLIARRPKSSQAMTLRARIVLGCAKGHEQRRSGREVPGSGRNLGQVAGTVSKERHGRSVGRATGGRAA